MGQSFWNSLIDFAMRSLLEKTVAWAREGAPDKLVRRNRLLCRRAHRALAVLQTGSQQDFARLNSSLATQTLHAARKTVYGRNYGTALEEWPVLTKTTLHAHPGHFTNRSAWSRIPASTGGTTGTPLSLWRSLECIAAEQAFIDSLLNRYGFSMHGSKVAVLRAGYG